MAKAVSSPGDAVGALCGAGWYSPVFMVEMNVMSWTGQQIFLHTKTLKVYLSVYSGEHPVELLQTLGPTVILYVFFASFHVEISIERRLVFEMQIKGRKQHESLCSTCSLMNSA